MANPPASTWDERYRADPLPPGLPEPFLVAHRVLLPTSGKALDVAGGAGASACWLAGLGLDVTLADLSTVALGQVADRARLAGVAVATRVVDLEREPLPAGPWDVITCFRFLHRPLFEAFPTVLVPGGLLIVVHPTASNLLRHDRPGRRHLLEDGELPGLVRGLAILRSEEGWGQDGRHEARIVARRGERREGSGDDRR